LIASRNWIEQRKAAAETATMPPITTAPSH
jgi:hypothetical protein